jgi:hypothetical protein
LRPITALRALAAVTIAPIVAWGIHFGLTGLFDVLHLRYPDWRFFMTSFYGYLLLGFVFAGVAAKLAPVRNQSFINLTILASVLGGVVHALVTDYGAAGEITIALAMVIGTVGYGLRLRGFSEPLHADSKAA